MIKYLLLAKDSQVYGNVAKSPSALQLRCNASVLRLAQYTETVENGPESLLINGSRHTQDIPMIDEQRAGNLPLKNNQLASPSGLRQQGQYIAKGTWMCNFTGESNHGTVCVITPTIFPSESHEYNVTRRW